MCLFQAGLLIWLLIQKNLVCFALLYKHNARGGGDSRMKQTGMLIVSLRGVNFGFWSRLGWAKREYFVLPRSCLGFHEERRAGFFFFDGCLYIVKLSACCVCVFLSGLF